MTLSVEMITFDCADPDALAQWWAQAVNGTVNAVFPGEFVLIDLPDGPNLGFQRVPDPTPGKNRVHLDFHVEDREAEVARFVEAGATVVGVREEGGFTWTTLADPDGNQFCLA